MTEEELNVLRERAKKAWARAEKNANKPLSKEEEQEIKEFQERCEAESWGFIEGAARAREKE